MRITLINGFFLPLPPISGGATEKSWFRLGREFAARGHEVNSFSRQWRSFPDREVIDGVHHIRLRGSDHSHRRSLNLLKDLLWSWRVYRQIPRADIVVCHAVTLPLWLGRMLPSAGRVVVMPGRIPKGQFRRYRGLARILAPSSPVRDHIVRENPACAPLIRVTGYPLDWRTLSQPQPALPILPARRGSEVTVGFIGRLHREKGLSLLTEAAQHLAGVPDLPPWKLILCGPSDVERGGSGGAYRSELLRKLGQSLNGDRFHVLDPQFNDRTLAGIYQRMDVFCYPSIAEQGETFGVAVTEAMAAGVAPVVSDLACFRDFIRPGENGLVFDHRAPDAAAQLAAALERLIRDAGERRRIAAQAQTDARRYDFPVFAEELLADFEMLARG